MPIHKLDGSGRRILVVDDDVAIRVLLNAVLTRMQFEVQLAQDGEVALQLLESESYDLILLDLMMPKIDGFEFLRRISRFPERPHIIVFTAAGKRGIDKIPEGAVCNAILKPFDLELFIDMIADCLAPKEGHADHTGSTA